mmetsp:Transcript_871/g.3224  ORF Transcript_871/g.3224 Transcript_871/m.3224 type:complete len:207 (-) Transcript_871:355-975(-)
MYSGVPWPLPRELIIVRMRTRDIPKSATLTVHLWSTKMFGLLRSRCRIGGDRECKYCIPLATDKATCLERDRSSLPSRLSMAYRLPRAINSVRIRGGSGVNPMNKSRFGCRSDASTFTSFRSSTSTSRPRSRSCFTATVVPAHFARKTSAKPPTASRSPKSTASGATSHSPPDVDANPTAGTIDAVGIACTSSRPSAAAAAGGRRK